MVWTTCDYFTWMSISSGQSMLLRPIKVKVKLTKVFSGETSIMLKIAFLAIFILKFCHALEVDGEVLAPSISVNSGQIGKEQLI